MASEIKRKSNRKWIRPFRKSSIKKVDDLKGELHNKSSGSVRSERTTSTSTTFSVSSDDSSNTIDSRQQESRQIPPSPPSSSPNQADSEYYGYGDASPDARAKYGYVEAAPDDIAKYGYGDAAPDDVAKYGYGDAAPDDIAKYGYGDASPDEAAPAGARMPRRSSMKGSSSSSARRRASLGACAGETMEVYLPGKREPVKRRRSITFKEQVKVQPMEPAKSLAENPESLWFQEDEYEKIKMKTVALIHKVAEDGTLDGKKYCTRGLEKWMTPEATQVKKRQAWDNVLNEQYLQRQEGAFNDEQLALMYKHSTARSQMEASKRASKDAQEVEGYLKSTRRFQRRMSM
eukprot:CAMPEP_0178747984 /NCGR_PEP_ID=MMETSP0744-20121128/8635_1 /TAXON_ID=913974 /ORGANISM="Nitzschia punctata, Strain CCMP561" /LENGTH=345 /DNA_ID=CAMNT_0020401301 /DNA_START=33 /DNA_END=1070 /DNA_ORIENTATION=-